MSIDWSPFDKWSEDTCQCRCGAVFRSHAKTVMTGASAPGHLELRSRKPCPSCKSENSLVRVSSDPETFTIQGSAEPFTSDAKEKT